MNLRKRVASKDLGVCGSPCLSKRGIANKWTLGALIAFAVLALGGRTAAAQAGVNCTNVQTPNMTIQIFNNSTTDNIYPVLFAGAKSNTDTWV
jgi:hypothetical protein